MRKIHKDITVASTLTGEFYNSNSIFKKTIDNIFNCSWQLINDRSCLKKDQYVYPFNFLGNVIPEPLILIKNKKINCFSNVCTHRGNILVDKPCQIKRNINKL